MRTLINRYYQPLLLLILALAFFARVYRLQVPDRYMFDEVYHAITAKLIARNDPRAFEWWNEPVEKDTAVDWLHPPLAKYTQALSMLVFGENSFGWRFSSAIFGVLVIAATAKLAMELFDDKPTALLAALLASLDGLLLVQSRIAMNDIHVTFFILLTLISYTRLKKLPVKNAPDWLPQRAGRYYLMTGLAAGLAMGSKWSGLYVLILVLIYEAYGLIKQLLLKTKRGAYLVYKPAHLKKYVKKLLIIFVSLIVLPMTLYVLSYADMFWQGKSFICHQQKQIEGVCYFERFKWGDQTIWEGYTSHFVELHRQIWWYQTTLNATHSYQSRPWQWFLDLRPVWYFVDYNKPNETTNIYAFGNPLLFWLGDAAVFMTIGYLILALLKKAKRPQLPISKLIFLLSAYLIVWLPWQLSPRIMFFYHYTPAVPLLCLILAYWLGKMIFSSQMLSLPNGSKIKVGPVMAATAILIIAITFILWYPQWTALPVPKIWANTLYFVIPSWK